MQADDSSITVEDLRALIEAAFEAAREKGKEDWNRMTTAVLMNRLLQMTGRRLNLEELGFESVAQAVAQFPDLVRVDHTTRPTTVELVHPLAPRQSNEQAVQRARERVRQDLWNAVLNYSTGYRWSWDPVSGRAQPLEPEDDTAMVLPTIAQQDLSQWRSQFVEAVRSTASENEVDRLERWQSRGLGTAALPTRLQGEWNRTLRAAVIERLGAWFAGHGLAVPNDIVVADPMPEVRQVDDELSRLRQLVIDCVRVMTITELGALNLPVGAVYRATKRR